MPGFDDPSNFILNGDFEKDGNADVSMPTDWSFADAAQTAAEMEVGLEPGGPFGVTGHCLRIKGTGFKTVGATVLSSWMGIVQHSTLAAGYYFLRYWVKVLGPKPARMRVEFGPTSGALLLNESYETEDAPAWTFHTLGFKVKTPATYRLHFRADNLAALGADTLTFLVDQVALVAWENGPGTPIEEPAVTSVDHKLGFDFGEKTTPLMKGYKLVTPDSAYPGPQGFGFLPTPTEIVLGGEEPRDDSPGPTVTNALVRDWLMAVSDTPIAHTFRVDAPNGAYKVTLLIGNPESGPVPYFRVFANGEHMLTIQPSRVTALLGDVSFWVDVDSGFLELTFASGELSNPAFLEKYGKKHGWLVNAVLISAQMDRAQDEMQLAADLSSFTFPSLTPPKAWQMLPTTTPAHRFMSRPEDFQRGYVPFTRCYTGFPTAAPPASPHEAAIYPDTAPDESERVLGTLPVVELTVTEREPILLGLHALRAIDRLAWNVTNLRRADDQTPAIADPDAWVHVRRIRYTPFGHGETPDARLYRHEPLLLVEAREIDLVPGRTEGLWITIHAPEGVTPGTYLADLVLSSAEGTEVITLTWRVLEFTLAMPADVVWNAIYDWEPATIDASLFDMREHGFTSVVLPPPSTTSSQSEIVAEVAARLSDAKSHGLTHPVAWHATEPAEHKYLGLTIVDDVADGFPVFTPEHAAVIQSTVQAVMEVAAQQQLEVLFYMADEPRTTIDPSGKKHAFRAQMAGLLSRAVKGVPGARTLMTFADRNTVEFTWTDPETSTVQALKKFVDVRVMTKDEALYCVDESEFAKPENTLVTGVPPTFWAYGPSEPLATVPGRLYTGFSMWGRGIKGASRWHYLDTAAMGNPYSSLVKTPYLQFKKPALVYPGLLGDEATIGWELLREGIEDYRYLATLESLLNDPSLADKAATIAPDVLALRAAAKIAGPEQAPPCVCPVQPWSAKGIHEARERVIAWIKDLEGLPA